jgi:threonine dehydratase
MEPAAVFDAAARLDGHIVRTPMLRAPLLDSPGARSVFVKAEVLQLGGSFKIRGALNRLLQLSESERRAGVVAWSSGNHAQGVAAAARIVGTSATIVMPADAPSIKIENTRRLGAGIVFYDRHREDRERIGRDLAERSGAVVVPSYDDAHIIAGQGTLGLEFATQVAAAGAPLDVLLVPCSGGGLTAGCALALEAASPKTAIYTVEPEGHDDHARSFASGRRERSDVTRPSLCDALQAPMPGELTFEINRPRVAGGLVVSDDEVARAMRFAFETLKLVVEPGGAVGLAALLAGKVAEQYARVGVILSGGNVDARTFAAILSACAPAEGD